MRFENIIIIAFHFGSRNNHLDMLFFRLSIYGTGELLFLNSIATGLKQNRPLPLHDCPFYGATAASQRTSELMGIIIFIRRVETPAVDCGTLIRTFGPCCLIQSSTTVLKVAAPSVSNSHSTNPDNSPQKAPGI